MPVTQIVDLTIVCDNPACPGNQLDPGDRAGWLFVEHAVYGTPPLEAVYCSVACVAGHTTALETAADPWE